LRYRYNNQKFNVSWDDDTNGDLVSFKQYQFYTAMDNDTLLLEQQLVTVPYLALIGALRNPAAAYLIAQDGAFAQWRNASAMYITLPARNVIWGYDDDPLLSAVKAALGNPADFPTSVPGLQNNDTSLSESLAQHSAVVMHTGVVDREVMMQYEEWDGAGDMLCCANAPCGDANNGGNPIRPWATDDANRIAGSEGSQFQASWSGEGGGR